LLQIETDPDNIFDAKMLKINGQHLTSGGIYAPPASHHPTILRQQMPASIVIVIVIGFTNRLVGDAVTTQTDHGYSICAREC
jgi:hypothetical protein